jgi:hypothetical protein
MTLAPKDVPVRLADKADIKRVLDEVNCRMGFVPDPDATVEQLHARMRADGIRPEENRLSSEIVRLRYEEE